MLTGRKIVLRALEREDLKLVHKWQNDEEVMRLTRSFPDHMISMEALESRYERELKGEDFEERVFVIVEKATDRAMGMARILVNQYTKRVTSAGIGLMIAEKDCRGKRVRDRSHPAVAEGGLRTTEPSQGSILDCHRQHCKRGTR